MINDSNSLNKNLVLMIDGFKHGGIQQSYKLLINEYVQHFKLVILIVMEVTSEDLNIKQHDNLLIVNLNSNRLLDFKGWVKLYIIFRRFKPTFIISSIYRSQVWSAIVKNRISKLIWIEHNTYFNRSKIQWLLMRFLKSRVSKVVGISNEVCEFTDLKLKTNSIFIPDPINKNKGDLQTTDRNNTFLFVGRLIDQKNPELALRSFAKFCETFNSPTFLHVIGNGPLFTQLKNLASKIGIENSCKFHGWLENDEIQDLMRNSRTLLSTSLFEGMALVRYEAISNGCCVITTNTGGVAGKLDKKEDLGIFVSPPSVEDLSNLMKTSLDSKLWSPEIMNARAELAKDLTAIVIASQLIA